MMTGARLLDGEISVVNVGLESFALTLEERGVPVVHVAWVPPAGGDPRRAARLAELADDADAPGSAGAGASGGDRG